MEDLTVSIHCYRKVLCYLLLATTVTLSGCSIPRRFAAQGHNPFVNSIETHKVAYIAASRSPHHGFDSGFRIQVVTS